MYTILYPDLDARLYEYRKIEIAPEVKVEAPNPEDAWSRTLASPAQAHAQVAHTMVDPAYAAGAPCDKPAPAAPAMRWTVRFWYALHAVASRAGAR